LIDVAYLLAETSGVHKRQEFVQGISEMCTYRRHSGSPMGMG
jgi:hypothetical protein